jgi:Zn finger protein HypA/HybF involved in hydrogenase expression
MRIIPPKAKPDDEQPNLEGEALCMQCQHEWAAVCPIGVVWLECPECHSMKGHMKYDVQRDGHEWKCRCGNDLFRVTPDGYYCPNCGTWQTGF